MWLRRKPVLFQTNNRAHFPTKGNQWHINRHSSKSEISLKLSRCCLHPLSLLCSSVTVPTAAGVSRDRNAIIVKDTDQHQPPPSIGPDNESSRAASWGNTSIHINKGCFYSFFTNSCRAGLKPADHHGSTECLGALLLTSTTVVSSIISTHPSKVKGWSPTFQLGWLASQYHVDHLISGPSSWHLNKHWIPTLCWRGARAEAAEACSKTSENRSYQHPPDGAPSLHHCLR